MKFSRCSQLKTTVSTLVLAISLTLGRSVTPASAHDVGQPHEPMPGVADVVRAPTDLPAPIGAREPQRLRLDLETVELTGQLDDGTVYRYWTFNRQVPGPFVRVRNWGPGAVRRGGPGRR